MNIQMEATHGCKSIGRHAWAATCGGVVKIFALANVSWPPRPSCGRPNWVSWHLTKDFLGHAPRADFHPDDDLPSGLKKVFPARYLTDARETVGQFVSRER